ncbi:c-type cytochrome biogenesis protein CcmI [Ochrobactrum sp. MYb15]|uniref:c-type cytochrome biogenesis protein CcmI n=1 Tax=Brucella TaxID=234 RepID=UPI0001C8730F|nr:c-type cytochrome biogenesis protein CcmI [Brucella rhizosphaerae]PQZ49569.1 c-type cytochrome biogenesis protein CcmI [Ochrobactrum sp. MYb19]PRA57209.1 c-type cytochrome biogenesis protein CcmI [Ochrobactrum sp. MYb68]PRA66613.1 c-type cytochrome biogenesis protein CcmI [Ochrobactrum sp. MYb18]PRA76357.1 c-type cytochrome biogenesis protein CcmI [Brucella thiophenivorans]PRA91623.1 c-type cytochrome biogenesis protein CcmI [Ochrobactrum sp. MYb14]PRA98364.1 c-type cytochrome biogenesis p
MEFWLTAALLTLAATLTVLLPLTRNKQEFLPPEKNDLEVYRDQLREVEADAARGMIDTPSAEQARIEISRRILNAEKASAESAATIRKVRSGRVLALAAVLAVPLIAWGVYPLFGAPDTPAMPLAARLANSPQNSSVDELIARAEAHLAQNPSDARGWDVLAPIYLRIGRGADAVNAYRSAIRLEGENFQRILGLGEALIGVSGGPVTAEAEGLFEKAATLEPDDIRPQYYLAQGEMQDGNADGAVKRLQTVLDKAPKDAPWRAQVEQTIARIRGTAPQAPAKGPTTEDVDAAASMNPEDRQAMVEGMVQRLDESLRENGGDIDSWKRLVRSYMILNRRDDALDALKRGVAALDGEKRAELTGFAAGLGLEAGSATQ